MTILLTSLVNSLPASIPFTGPETLERKRGAPFNARLGANESAYGISPMATAALLANIGVEGCSWYGDPEHHELRSQLAEKHGVAINCICVDAGIDTLLGVTVRAYVEPATPVVTSLGAYPTFNYHVSGSGGRLCAVPYRDHHEDSEALLKAACEEKARLVYLSNPDNPMGTSLTQAAIQSMIDGLPAHATLLLDEAYVEFMNNEELVPLDPENSQVIRFRTFSKAYGMAGMRIGYAIAHPDIITGLNKIRNHFGVNKLAQIAASASLRDTTFLASVNTWVNTGRQRIYTLAEKHKLEYLPSSTNFVAVNMRSAEAANLLLSQLTDAGVFLRKPMTPPQDQFIRIGVGTEAEHAFFDSVLSSLL